MATNTATNTGVRRMITSLSTPQYRNFEPVGQLYKAIRSSYEYMGVTYHNGDVIPYDAGGGTVYGNCAQLERDFNSGLIDPAS